MTEYQLTNYVFFPFGLLIAGIFVRYFIKLVDDVGAIKTFCQVQTEKHNNLEKRVEKLEEA
jgi:hypothetical protein